MIVKGSEGDVLCPSLYLRVDSLPFDREVKWVKGSEVSEVKGSESKKVL